MSDTIVWDEKLIALEDRTDKQIIEVKELTNGVIKDVNLLKQQVIKLDVNQQHILKTLTEGTNNFKSLFKALAGIRENTGILKENTGALVEDMRVMNSSLKDQRNQIVSIQQTCAVRKDNVEKIPNHDKFFIKAEGAVDWVRWGGKGAVGIVVITLGEKVVNHSGPWIQKIVILMGGLIS